MVTTCQQGFQRFLRNCHAPRTEIGRQYRPGNGPPSTLHVIFTSRDCVRCTMLNPNYRRLQRAAETYRHFPDRVPQAQFRYSSDRLRFSFEQNIDL